MCTALPSSLTNHWYARAPPSSRVEATISSISVPKTSSWPAFTASSMIQETSPSMAIPSVIAVTYAGRMLENGIQMPEALHFSLAIERVWLWLHGAPARKDHLKRLGGVRCSGLTHFDHRGWSTFDIVLTA